MTDSYNIQLIDNVGLCLTPSAKAAQFMKAKMLVFVPWMKPFAERGGAGLRACQLRAELHPIQSRGPELASKHAESVFVLVKGEWLLERDKIRRKVDPNLDSREVNAFQHLLASMPQTQGTNPGGFIAMAACDFKRAALETLDSGTLLRRMYRNVIGTTGGHYPKREGMIAALERLGQAHNVAMPTPITEPAPAPTPESTPTMEDDDMDVDVSNLSIGQLSDLAQKAAKAEKAKMTMMKSVQDAKQATTEANAEVARLTKQLESAQLYNAPAPVAVSSPDGKTIEVMGTTLPVWGCEDAPKADDRYDLTAWRAQLKVSDETFEANAAEVAKAIIDGDSVRLIGPPSVGKTSGIKQVAALTGAKFFLVQCGEGATDLSLIGCQTVAEGTMSWQDGSITSAVRWASNNPGVLTLIVLDEVDHLMPEVQSLMHGVLEGGALQYDGTKELQVPDNVRFVATANTSGFGDITGRHASAKVSDTAFVSRWNVTYDVTYLPPEAEAKVLARAGADPAQAEAAVKVANESRVEGSSLTQPIVLRQLLSWARGCGAGEDPKKAWAFRVLSGMPEHDRPACWEITKLQFDW